MKKVTQFIVMIAFMALSSVSVAHTETHNESEKNLQQPFKQNVNAVYDAALKAVVITIDVHTKENATIKIANSRGYAFIQQTEVLRGGSQVIEVPVTSLRDGTYQVFVFSKSIKFNKAIRIR